MGVVLITGCSSGFGLEAALAFARRGNTVVATMRNTAKADALRGRAAEEGLHIQVEQLDVVDQQSVDAAVEIVLRDHGTIDVLVNNAGVMSNGPIETQPLDRAMQLMDTNFWGPVRLVRSVLPTMREHRSGVIVNVGSISGRIPGTPYGGMYAASKHALGAMSEALASELEPFSIRVVCIEPGFFATEILANSLSFGADTSEAYADGQAWFQSFMDANAGEAPGPAIVADAIVAAAEDPAAPLHYPIGDDTLMYLDLLKQVDGFEGWVATTTPIVESVAGPRPTLG